jgi:hypothetical protein
LVASNGRKNLRSVPLVHATVSKKSTLTAHIKGAEVRQFVKNSQFSMFYYSELFKNTYVKLPLGLKCLGIKNYHLAMHVLTFILLGWVFKFESMVYKKHEYYLNRKRLNYETLFCGK